MGKKLRVFEAFAGIGAQNSALKRANLNYEIVGISEWFINALLCYDAIHSDKKKKIVLPSHEEQINYLKKYTFSKDSVNPVVNIEKLSDAEIEHLGFINKDYEKIKEKYTQILRLNNSKQQVYLLDNLEINDFYIPPKIANTDYEYLQENHWTNMFSEEKEYIIT